MSNTVPIPVADLEHLIRLAEVGAHGLMEPARSAAIMRIRAAESLVVTATGRSANFP